jgi:hypothetical protein
MKVYHPITMCPLCALERPVKRERAVQAVQYGLNDYPQSVDQCPQCRTHYVLSETLRFRTIEVHNCAREA